jgi:uncharacterized protein YaaW (UPF0174 family)
MPYELGGILDRCNEDDYKVFVDIIDNYLSFTDNKKLNSELLAFHENPSVSNRDVLNRHMEKCIRYFGSADLAYLWRYLFSNDKPAGVSVGEIIDDVGKRLKVTPKKLGSTEARLERLVKKVAEKTFFDLTPEKQRELFIKAGLSVEQQRTFFEKIKNNKAMFLPMLLPILGPKIVMELLEGLIVLVLAGFMTRQAAKQILKRLLTRIPWVAEWLGPIVWIVSLGWVALDIQSPAYRKTVPALLYLGVICLRDGPAEGDKFWSDAD